ncbi:MAG: methionine synthase, partial [Duncaniella sp.]|nr:methionine synthase [Duncaniella sp.]
MKSEIIQQLDARILLLDGAMGTMIQQYKLTDRDYKGNRFSDITIELKGCHDILSLTCPDIIADIHRKYLEAGADIITTNTFNANTISLRDYGLEDYSYEINLEAARIARREADKISAITPSRPRFTAGTVGPTNKTSSMSADIMNPASREVTFSELVEAYKRQIEGLIDGGTDIILIETVFDTLNAKAALYAVDEVAECRGKEIPVMISATMYDSSGRTLSGQTLEAFYTSVSHARLLSVGLNCAFGPSQLLPYAIRLAKIAECRVSCHPNAGLPNALGEYDETPEAFAAKIEEYLKEGCVNIIGGCCGTTPRHIHEISKFIDNYPPREIPERDHTLRLSNLEQLCIAPESNFINIGERTNVAGSAKFAGLIREGNFTEAVSIARRQIEAGAQIIDVCMDDSMINGAEAMQTFLNLIASEPEIARVPVMIDSSDWNVIEAGLRACQGKCIVNSISLKEGEESFLSKAKRIRRYGAALVVMLFDEEGQADTYEKKCKVAERSYRLLTQHGFPAEDIIFDPNILTIATGIAEHDSYAADFINALRWIKEHLPHCHLSGGVSNLSFAFRGNNHIREAMHSVFLFHAIAAGLDMAIVNSQMLRVYSEIEPQLLTLIEDLIFMRRPDATERLIEYSTSATNDIVPSTTDETISETLPVEQRIRRLLLKGISDGLENDLKEAQEQHPSALKIIESMLMPAMDEIGILFGEGKMFLPQVIKSARVLKEAISILAPSMKATHSPISHGKVLIATVRGDIHDIGKNIVSLVVGCNGYEVTDLGVMAEAKMIADKAEQLKPIAIMLSGLITPSLNEMVEVCKELERRDIRIPVIIGGATTTPLHTALKIAPEYSGVVLHAPDASYNSRFLARLRSDDSQLFIEQTKAGQEKLRQDYQNSLSKSARLLSIEAARNKSIKKTVPSPMPKSTERFVAIDFDIAEVEPFINWD